MREIKFRAWIDAEDCSGKRMIYWELFDNNETLVGYEFVRKKDPIMQFTGLKDKNEKKIFEGDIFNCIYNRDGCNHKLIIVWDENDARFKLRNIGECDQLDVYQSLFDIQREEVIGNKFENPELLEQEKKCEVKKE